VFIALTLVVILLISMVIFDKIGLPMQQRHELFVEVNGASAFIAFGFVAFWLAMGIPRGQYPTFSLWPLVVVGVLFSLSALRANKVYKDRYGNAPASQ